jgi:hypothetical protein
LTQGFDAVGKQQRPPAHPGRREGGLGPGMTATHDNYVETLGKQHVFKR